jgi:hypothetical protein
MIRPSTAFKWEAAGGHKSSGGFFFLERLGRARFKYVLRYKESFT